MNTKLVKAIATSIVEIKKHLKNAGYDPKKLSQDQLQQIFANWLVETMTSDPDFVAGTLSDDLDENPDTAKIMDQVYPEIRNEQD